MHTHLFEIILKRDESLMTFFIRFLQKPQFSESSRSLKFAVKSRAFKSAAALTAGRHRSHMCANTVP